jgi:hypothetical protein
LVVTKGPVPDDTVWLAPETVALVVEIVSKGSERMDRIKGLRMTLARLGAREAADDEPDLA